jgi:hypothetical protein
MIKLKSAIQLLKERKINQKISGKINMIELNNITDSVNPTSTHSFLVMRLESNNF